MTFIQTYRLSLNTIPHIPYKNCHLSQPSQRSILTATAHGQWIQLMHQVPSRCRGQGVEEQILESSAPGGTGDADHVVVESEKMVI
jgi:hypothetical protein